MRVSRNPAPLYQTAPHGPVFRWVSAASPPTPHTPEAPCTPATLSINASSIFQHRQLIRTRHYSQPCNTPLTVSLRCWLHEPLPPLLSPPDVGQASLLSLPVRSGILGSSPESPSAQGTLLS